MLSKKIVTNETYYNYQFLTSGCGARVDRLVYIVSFSFRIAGGEKTKRKICVYCKLQILMH
jgi:hypothetical protein